VAALLEAINGVRPKLWKGRGKELLGPVAYLDADGTIAPTTGQRKAGMDMSYKGIWGYAPLIVSLANTREVPYLVDRPGNAPSHQDAAAWIDKAIDLELRRRNLRRAKGLDPQTMQEMYSQVVTWTQSGQLTFDLVKVPLSDIETAWQRTDLRGSRLVVTP
jgi:hypothetical protein